jgi:transposase
MLGLDVSKASVAYTLLDPTTTQILAAGRVPNTADGVTQLLALPAEHPWVAEPTGVYSQALVRGGQQAGRTVLLAPPREAKAFLRARHPRAKTDRLDSLGLAHYALAVPLRPFPLKSETVVQLDQLLAARKGLSASLAQLTQQRQVLPYAATVLDAAIAALQEQQRTLDGQIATLTQEPELAVAHELHAIPGIGPVTAAALAACLASHSFSHPDQFVAYLGLDVQVRESGELRGQAHLSKHGDPELRRLLYCCAQANLRSRDPDNPFKRQYQRERAKGLAPIAALNVVARKLARTAWSIATHGTSYDPARVHHQPKRRPPVDPPPPLDTQP